MAHPSYHPVNPINPSSDNIAERSEAGTKDLLSKSSQKLFMLYIPCPFCGLRNETEFHYGAEAGVAYPDPNTLTDSEWATYLHIRANPRGWLAERWVHFAGCGRWFNLWRNTVTHEIGPAYLPFTTQPAFTEATAGTASTAVASAKVGTNQTN